MNGFTTTRHTPTFTKLTANTTISQKTPSKSKAAGTGSTKSLLDLIADCNNKTKSELEAYPHLYLPDEAGNLKFYGVLQKHVFTGIPWSKYGFETRGKSTVQPANGQATPEAITSNLKKMCRDTDVQKFEGIKKWAAKDEKSDAEYVGLIAGHPDVRIPDPLGVHFGVAQVGVHLTLYKTNPLRVLVQVRAKTASYGGKLDQTGAGGRKHGESVFDGAIREGKEEIGPGIQDLVRIKRPVYDGQIVFATTRPDDAGKFVGTFEISTKASWSFEVPKEWERNAVPEGERDKDVKDFKWMTEEEIIAAMKANEFKLNSALVMMRFLSRRGQVFKKEQGYEDIIKGLEAKIPLPLPADLKTYGEKKKPTPQDAGN